MGLILTAREAGNYSLFAGFIVTLNKLGSVAKVKLRQEVAISTEVHQNIL